MVNIKRFVNNPVPSNTFLLSEEGTNSCVIVDPGTKDESKLLSFIEDKGLSVDFIILTHEHFDHCWGVNYLLERTDAKVIASCKCANSVKQPSNYFNKFYFDSDEKYNVNRVDLLVEELNYELDWKGEKIEFFDTKGHSDKGICINIGNKLFTGDTLLLNTKPVLIKRSCASKQELEESLKMIFSRFQFNTIIYPGHGDPFCLNEAKPYYERYFNKKMTC